MTGADLPDFAEEWDNLCIDDRRQRTVRGIDGADLAQCRQARRNPRWFHRQKRTAQIAQRQFEVERRTRIFTRQLGVGDEAMRMLFASEGSARSAAGR